MDFPADFDVEAFLKPFKEKHGDGEVCAVMTVSGPVAFRTPTAPEYERFKAMTQSPADRPKAGKVLCLLTVLSPDRAAFGAILDKKPGIVDTCLDEVLTLAGVDPHAAVKK